MEGMEAVFGVCCDERVNEAPAWTADLNMKMKKATKRAKRGWIWVRSIPKTQNGQTTFSSISMHHNYLVRLACGAWFEATAGILGGEDEGTVRRLMAHNLHTCEDPI